MVLTYLQNSRLVIFFFDYYLRYNSMQLSVSADKHTLVKGRQTILKSQVFTIHNQLKSANETRPEALDLVNNLLRYSKILPEWVTFFGTKNNNTIRFGNNMTFEILEDLELFRKLQGCNKVAMLLPKPTCLQFSERLLHTKPQVYIGNKVFSYDLDILFHGSGNQLAYYKLEISRASGHWVRLNSSNSATTSKRRKVGSGVYGISGNIALVFMLFLGGVFVAVLTFLTEKIYGQYTYTGKIH